MNKAELRHVPLQEITEGSRFRVDYGEHTEWSLFVKSIEEKGILQPITLDQNYNLMAGGRRYTAAKQLNLPAIPCLIRESSGDIDLREVELIENIQRKDLTWQEKIKLTAEIDNMYKEKDPTWSGRKTADIVNKSIGTVSQHLQLAEAMAVVPELAKCKTEDDARKLIKKAEKHLTVRKLREEQDERMADIPMVQHAKTHFIVGDAFTGMQEIIDRNEANRTQSTIKLIEVDPPYGIDLNEVKKGDETNPAYLEVKKDEYAEWLNHLAGLLYQVAAPDCWVIFWFGPTWFCEVKSALIRAGFAVDDIPAIWNKGSGQTNAPQVYLGRAYEPFFIARKGSPSINNQGRSNVFSTAPVNPSNKWHPTQRPLPLIEDILATFGFPGTVCLSPFLGSGTTLMAAYKQHMACFGWDLNKKCKDRFLLEVEDEFRQAEVNEKVKA